MQGDLKPLLTLCRSRQKHLHSKRLASQSPAALAEILGVSVASLSPTASPSPAPVEITETTATASGSSTPQDPTRTAEETISTSTLSVSDYFRQKLREKMLARQSASGSSTPAGDLPEGSLARVKEEVKVAVGGVEWEGSRTTFAEVKLEDAEDVKPDIKPKIEDLDDKALRRLAKEERRRLKAAKRETLEDIKPDISADTTPAPPAVEADETPALSKEERKRQKEEKRRRKEEKRAQKESAEAAPQETSKRKRDKDDPERIKKSKKDKSA